MLLRIKMEKGIVDTEQGEKCKASSKLLLLSVSSSSSSDAIITEFSLTLIWLPILGVQFIKIWLFVHSYCSN